MRASSLASSIFPRRSPSRRLYSEQYHPCNPSLRACVYVCLYPRHEVYLLARRSYRSDYHAWLTRISTTICSPTWIVRFDTAASTTRYFLLPFAAATSKFTVLGSQEFALLQTNRFAINCSVNRGWSAVRRRSAGFKSVEEFWIRASIPEGSDAARRIAATAACD